MRRDSTGAKSESREERHNGTPAHPTPGEDCEGQTEDSAEEGTVDAGKFVPSAYPVLTAHGPPPSVWTSGRDWQGRVLLGPSGGVRVKK